MTIALTDLETAIADTRAGRRSFAEMLRAFVDADCHLPSAAPVWPSGAGFRPVTFERDGAKMLACYTDLGRMDEVTALAPFCLRLTGRAVLACLPRTHGLALNPGQSIGFEVAPRDVRRIRADFA